MRNLSVRCAARPGSKGQRPGFIPAHGQRPGNLPSIRVIRAIRGALPPLFGFFPGAPTGRVSRQALKGPPFAVIAVEEVARCLRIEYPARNGVVLHGSFDQGGEVDELHQLSQWSTDLETGECLAVAFARFDPLLVVTD